MVEAKPQPEPVPVNPTIPRKQESDKEKLNRLLNDYASNLNQGNGLLRSFQDVQNKQAQIVAEISTMAVRLINEKPMNRQQRRAAERQSKKKN